MSHGTTSRLDPPWLVVDHWLGEIRMLVGVSLALTPGPIDVEVLRPSGQRLVASFASIEDIQRLMEAAYWAADLVIVTELSANSVVAAVEWLAERGELEHAFDEASPGKPQTG